MQIITSFRGKIGEWCTEKHKIEIGAIFVLLSNFNNQEIENQTKFTSSPKILNQIRCYDKDLKGSCILS